MIKLTVKELAGITGGELTTNNEDALVRTFSIDSRTICPGDFFIAVKGENFDGHDYIEEAVSKGASGLIVEREVHAEGVSHILKVTSTREAMGKIAAEIRNRTNIPVICITGTSGKTTLKEMLGCILSSKYKVLKNKKSYNNIIGLSLTLFELDTSHQIAVLELGTNRSGEIQKLAEIARPSVCVITNIGLGHLEFLKTREGVFSEKIKMLDFLGESGTAFLNKDDSLLRDVGTSLGKVKFFGASGGSDFLVADIKKETDGYSFSLNGSAFFIPLDGEHNVYNAAAAIAVSKEFGISEEKVRSGLKETALPGMRLERVEAAGVIFINDSYNANPGSFESALKVLQDASGAGKKGVVAGGMMELGEEAVHFHQMIGKSMAEKKIDFLITVGDMAEHIAQGALKSGMAQENVLRARGHEEAAEMIRRVTSPGDVVLIKGSRVNKMEEVIKCFTTFCIH
jgi:UDP-N-acetylmuramoyl-tripeptide--D-alanyl-D-alanine ligase